MLLICRVLLIFPDMPVDLQACVIGEDGNRYVVIGGYINRWVVVGGNLNEVAVVAVIGIGVW